MRICWLIKYFSEFRKLYLVIFPIEYLDFNSVECVGDEIAFCICTITYFIWTILDIWKIKHYLAKILSISNWIKNILKIKYLENGSAIESDGGETNPEIIKVFTSSSLLNYEL